MRRLFSFGARTRRDRRDEVDEELRFHLDRRAADLEAAGWPPLDARRQAQSEFGDVDDARRFMRRADDRIARANRRRNFMGDLGSDIRLALRRLRRSPAFTATALVTLAIGIGANVAVFSIVHAVLVRPLPLPSPERLYAVYSVNRTSGALRAPVSVLDVDDWRAERRLLEDLGGYFFAEGSTGIDLTGRGAPRRLTTVFVTPGFFGALGVVPVEGRLPREDEMVRGGRDTVVVLSHAFWTSEFAASPSAVGASLTLGGRPYEIVGVLPREVRVPTDQADVFVPYSTIPDTSIPRVRGLRILSVIARARAGVAPESVQTEMNTIASRLAAREPDNRLWDAATVVPLAETIAGPVRRPLVVMMTAVALVLLIACANLAGLQLSRAVGHAREMGVRVALGARRARLVRQHLTESLVLAAAGGAGGLALGVVGLNQLLALGARELPRAADIHVHPIVVVFTLGVTAISGLLIGTLPAWRASADLQGALRETGRVSAGHRAHRLRATVVVVEVALAVALTVGAGLAARSFGALVREDPGFQPEGLVAVQFTLDPARHGARSPAPNEPAPYVRVYQEAIARVRALPGVVAAAAVKDPPLRGIGERNSFQIPGRPPAAGQDTPTATSIHVSDGYFATIGARLLDGREFTPQDRMGAPWVLVVNDAFARQFFPGERAVGQRLLFAGRASVEIIGVVRDIRQVAVAEAAQPTFYLHNLQNSRVKTTIVARTQGAPLAMAPAIRDVIWSLDPLQPITAIFTFDDSLNRALARPRLLAVLLLALSGVGLVLGVVGIYGMLAFLVQQRRRDIGVRLALGARPADVRNLFVRQGLAMAVLGVALGLAAATALTRLMTDVLYGVGPYDPATLGAVALTMLVAATLASWVPAARAARLDPVTTLRAD
jgi:predicted permease